MSNQTPFVQSGDPLNDFLKSFWQRQVDAAEQETPDYRHPPLPLARIKKVMKSDPDVKVIAVDLIPILCDSLYVHRWSRQMVHFFLLCVVCAELHAPLIWKLAPILFCKACESRGVFSNSFSLLSDPSYLSIYLRNYGTGFHCCGFQQTANVVKSRYCEGAQ